MKNKEFKIECVKAMIKRDYRKDGYPEDLFEFLKAYEQDNNLILITLELDNVYKITIPEFKESSIKELAQASYRIMPELICEID